MDLKGKTAFVTGASSGLGRQFALALAAAGAAVTICGRRRERLETVAAEIDAAGGRAHVLPLDVTDFAALPAAIAEAETVFGPLWVLVNNSGVAITGDSLSFREDDFDQIMATNVKAPYFLSQAAAKAMIRHGGGRIINIASIGAFRPLGMQTPYSLSKAALAHMTKCLALEWARHNINVNAICPGYIRTEINTDFFDSELGAKLLSKFPRRRAGKDDDLNGLLLLLASEAGNFITGSLIIADDGQFL